jgi:hypothetical protein
LFNVHEICDKIDQFSIKQYGLQVREKNNKTKKTMGSFKFLVLSQRGVRNVRSEDESLLYALSVFREDDMLP